VHIVREIHTLDVPHDGREGTGSDRSVRAAVGSIDQATLQRWSVRRRVEAVIVLPPSTQHIDLRILTRQPRQTRQNTNQAVALGRPQQDYSHLHPTP
jgi:hypothetical protein